ncbi:MAG: EamA family transporter [Methylocystaceae bacterium]|nr:EamA family transporter [Methylocystaceae bacterium]
MPQRPDHIQGLIFATLGALALTPDGLLVRLAGTEEWSTVFWRGLYIGIGLFITQLIQHRKAILKHFPPNSLKEWFAAFLSSIGTLCFVMAVKHTTVANTLVILSTMSLFAALFSMIFLKERIALRTWIAMAAAICGIIIVFMDDLSGDDMLGKLIALTCAFVTAGCMTVIRSERSMNVQSVFAWGGLLSTVPALYFAPNLAVDTQASITLIVMGGLNALAFVLIGAGAKRIPSPEVSLLMLLETILGPIWVWFILQEAPSPNALIGGAIVVTTLALHSIASLKKRRT